MNQTKKIYRMKKIIGNYKCDKCSKTFVEERFLKKHLTRKEPCDKIYKCSKCHKTFKEERFYNSHMERKTPCAPDTIPVISVDNIENKCHMCGKEYSNAYNLKRHQKNCNVMINPRIIMELVEQNRELGEQNRELISMLKDNQHQTVNQTVNNNLTVQQNLYVNVTICSFGSEDLTKLDQQGVIDLLKGQVEDFMPRMIEYIHANPKHPEYHNVFYDPVRKKALVFRQNQDKQLTWQFEDIDNVSKLLTNKIKDHIHPLNGPYFNSLAKEDSDTANKIPQILCMNWGTPEIVEGTKSSLSKVTQNEGFMDQVSIME